VSVIAKSKRRSLSGLHLAPSTVFLDAITRAGGISGQGYETFVI